MAALDPAKSRSMETVAAFVIIAFTFMEGFITIAPYVGLSASGADVATLAQQQTLVQTIMVAIVSFLFGASVGTQKKDDAIQTLSNTAAAVQAALTPAAAVTLQPNEKVEVAAAASTDSPPPPKP